MFRLLPPPNLERIFTKEELAEHDGSKGDEGTIYVAIKGTVFDVTAKRAMYGPSGGYHCFAGKDASKVIRRNKAQSTRIAQAIKREKMPMRRP
jgi:predicted heme/steroid binding protein